MRLCAGCKPFAAQSSRLLASKTIPKSEAFARLGIHFENHVDQLVLQAGKKYQQRQQSHALALTITGEVAVDVDPEWCQNRNRSWHLQA